MGLDKLLIFEISAVISNYFQLAITAIIYIYIFRNCAIILIFFLFHMYVSKCILKFNISYHNNVPFKTQLTLKHSIVRIFFIYNEITKI